MVETVKFNVGGRQFEVSRALIDEHSDTVLGKLFSDAWNEDPEQEVFIDRNGDLFAQVLEYLRYGSIDLPITVPRSMFEREIDYYGVVSDGKIIDKQTIAGVMASLDAPVVEAQENVDAAQKKLVEAKKERDTFLLALDFGNRFCLYRMRKPNAEKASFGIVKNHELYGRPVDGELLEVFLGNYFGLTLRNESFSYGYCSTVYVKDE